MMDGIPKEFRPVVKELQRAGFVLRPCSHGWLVETANGMLIRGATIPRKARGKNWSSEEAHQVLRKVQRAFPSLFKEPEPATIRLGQEIRQDDGDSPQRTPRLPAHEGIVQVRTKRQYGSMPHRPPPEPGHVTTTFEGSDVRIVSDRARPAVAKAARDMTDLLTGDKWIRSSTVVDAMTEAGHSEYAIDEASRLLKVRKERGGGFQSPTYWFLPQDGVEPGMPPGKEGTVVTAAPAGGLFMDSGSSKKQKFYTTIPKPDSVKYFYETIRGSCGIEDDLDDSLSVSIEAEDMWELRGIIEELRDTLQSQFTDAFEIPKPQGE